MAKKLAISEDIHIGDTGIELGEFVKKTSLWTGSSLATMITLSDNSSKYKYFYVKTDKNYNALVPAILYGSSVVGKSVIENSNYARYEVYFYISTLTGNKIQFQPTFLFRNGAYNAEAKITEIIGLI